MNRSRRPQEKPATTRSLSLFILLVLTAAGYLGYQIGPTYLNLQSEEDLFRSELAVLAGKATVGQWQDPTIIAQVRDLAKKRNFRLELKDIHIQRRKGQPDVTLHVSYGRTERLLGRYDHDFRFQASVKPFGAS